LCVFAGGTTSGKPDPVDFGGWVKVGDTPLIGEKLKGGKEQGGK